MEALVDFLHRLAFLVGADGDGCAVRVCPRDHQHFVPFKSVVARDDVPGQMRTGDISDMDFGVGVGPGNGDQDVFGHRSLHEV